MDKFLTKLIDIDRGICDNIDQKDVLGAGSVSLNIVNQLNQFIQAIAMLCCSRQFHIEDNADGLANALKYLKFNKTLRFVADFYNSIQVAILSINCDVDEAERFLYRHTETLSRCKVLLKEQYGIDVLHNLQQLPMARDVSRDEYYKKIAMELDKRDIVAITESPTNRFYVQKKKSFCVHGQKYYELTLADVSESRTSKLDHFVVFSKLDIPIFYAFHPRLEHCKVHIHQSDISIKIITGFRVSVRPCEFVNFFKLMGFPLNIVTRNKEYISLMGYLTKTGKSLSELLECDDQEFYDVKEDIYNGLTPTKIFDGLELCRQYRNKPGYNVLVYLLHKLRNQSIRDQYFPIENNQLSKLYLQNGCIPFDTMPYARDLPKHRTSWDDLSACIEITGREHEILARTIKNNTELKGQIYTPIADLSVFRDVDLLIEKYNSLLYSYHKESSALKQQNGFVYINGYEQKAVGIIRELNHLSSCGMENYQEFFQQWMENVGYVIDSAEKYQILKDLFATSKVALIYGSAGTGKTTTVRHITNLFADKQKIYLAHTHSATENLRRRVGSAANSEFSTVKSHIYSGCPSCDILFIDECSTVSNDDMLKILSETEFDLLVLVGDIYQMESIQFGNWFDAARSLVAPNAIFELSDVHRSSNDKLQQLWKSVRTLDGKTADLLEGNGFVSSLDESIFNKVYDDEIILCLNYDGLYGISNINKILQDNNKTKSVTMGVDVYKVGDKVVFKECDRFHDIFYNNLKGTIVDINEEDLRVQFYIEVDKVFDELDIQTEEFVVEKQTDDGKSVVSFWVSKFVNEDDDDKADDAIVPFQIAYAISIHKAQGLEYDSVKIVITDEIEQLISHNVFYTAITRAKKSLKIYWSKNAQSKILKNMKELHKDRDIAILSEKFRFRRFDC